jgi:outer membrane protein assembly factor BamD
VKRHLAAGERKHGWIAAWGKLIPVVLIVALCLSGCAWLQNWFQKSPMVGTSPEALYRRGYEDYQDGRYKKAVESFVRLKEENPLSDLAILAELGIADAYFSDEEYAEAEVGYADFINLHPTNENLPYAMYQLGMCHYNQIPTIDRDQTETLRAKKSFETLLARFPSSKFSFMAEKMLLECKKHLAEQEFYIGEFYFNRKKYKAALSRFELIAKNYANLGLDYKIDYFIDETKRRLAQEGEHEKREQKEK